MTIKLSKFAQLFEQELKNQQTLLWRYALAQACHESAWFRSRLVLASYNAWGIKYVGQSGCTPIEFNTHEYNSRGEAYQVVQRFCKYLSPGRAVTEYFSLVQRRYPRAWEARTAQTYFAGLSGWATDPNYERLLMKVYLRIFTQPE